MRKPGPAPLAECLCSPEFSPTGIPSGQRGVFGALPFCYSQNADPYLFQHLWIEPFRGIMQLPSI